MSVTQMPSARRASAEGQTRIDLAACYRLVDLFGWSDLINTRITARVPDATEQSFFGLAHDATVFEIFRTGFDQTGTPLRVTVTVWPADRNQFIVNFGDVPVPRYEDEQEEASEPA